VTLGWLTSAPLAYDSRIGEDLPPNRTDREAVASGGIRALKPTVPLSAEAGQPRQSGLATRHLVPIALHKCTKSEALKRAYNRGPP
jgi:hypothetical protein